MGKLNTFRKIAWLLISGLIIYGLLTHPERLWPWTVKEQKPAPSYIQPRVLPNDAKTA